MTVLYSVSPSFLANSRVPQGPTDELLTWLSKVNQKRHAVRESRRRDLLKEALLESSRRAAQGALEAKQRERMYKWRQMMGSMAPTPPPSPPRDENLCDCDSCFLCQRHKSQMHGKCYCHVIFSPRPVYMEFHRAQQEEKVDEDSLKIDEFLASLSSVPGLKRKCEDARTEDALMVGRKRAKA